MNVNRLFGKCRRYDQSLSLMAAGRLSSSEREALNAHLAGCPECRAELAQLQRVSQDLEDWKQSHAAVAANSKRYYQIRQALKNAQVPQSRGVRAGCADWLRRKWPVWSALGAAWALILFFNLDSPTIKVVERSQPVSPKTILMVLKSGKPERLHKSPELPAEPAGLPPESRLRFHSAPVEDC